MNCHCVRAALDLYAEKRLTAGRTAAIESHLSTCAECRAESHRDAVPLSAQISSAFHARLKKSLKASVKEPVPAPKPLYLPLFPRETLGVVFASVALALLGLWAGYGGVTSQSIEGDEIARESVR